MSKGCLFGEEFRELLELIAGDLALEGVEGDGRGAEGENKFKDKR